MTAAEVVPAADRGGLLITRHALERLVAQVASEVGAVNVVRRPLGLAVAETPIRPRAAVQIDGNQAYVSVEVGLAYPTPLRPAADELRAHLTERVAALSGVRVQRLDLRVTWLVAADEQPRRLA